MGLLKEFREELKKKEEQQKIARLLYGGTQSTTPSSFVAYPEQAPIGYNKGGVVGEHRKMFRKPGLARQALGILASSGELMNEVQPRMRMAQAGAVNKSLFDQATQMVDQMIADQGRITLPLRMRAGISTLPAGTSQMPFYTPQTREEGINALYRDLMAQQTPAPSLPGYMDPQTGPMDVKGSISDTFSSAMDYLGRTRRPEEATGMEAIGVASQEAGSRAAQKERAEQVTLENTPATVTPDTGPMGAAASDDPPADLGQDQTGNDQNADLLKQLEDLKKERDRLSDLIDKDEKEAIDPFLERYKEMTGNDEDDFYQAMMTAGLAIAGGQSDDAVSNIARGALAGLQQYSKSKKDRRDSLFLAEIQARKLKAAETPAQVQLLEYLQANPDAAKLYQSTYIKDRSTENERDLVNLAAQYKLPVPLARQLQLDIEIAKSYGGTIDIAQRAKELRDSLKDGTATVTK